MVASALARGGSERQLIATTEGLVRLGYDVQVFAFADPYDGHAGLAHELQNLGITPQTSSSFALRIGKGALSHVPSFDDCVACVPSYWLHYLEAVSLAIHDCRPAVVHTWSDFSTAVAAKVSSAMGVPRIVVAQRNVPPFRPEIDESNLFREIYRSLSRNPAVVMLNNSSSCAQQYEDWIGLDRGTIRVIYNGFLPRTVRSPSPQQLDAYRRHLGWLKGTRIVGAIMRYADQKDPHLWLETVRQIADARPDVRFLLRGYGDLRDTIDRKIDELGLRDRIAMVDTEADIGLLYATLDVFLMTSRFEGLPNVLIEAQAAGRPVVSTDVGGTREAVIDGVTGRIVSSRSPHHLCRAVLEILDDPSWSSRAASQAPAFVEERFGLDRMVSKTLEAGLSIRAANISRSKSRSATMV